MRTAGGVLFFPDPVTCRGSSGGRMDSDSKTVSYHDAWVARGQKDRADLEKIVKRDPYVRWENNFMPEGTAADCLRLALELMYVEEAGGLDAAFLKKCSEIIDRIERENKLTSSPRTEAAFPLNRGELRRIKAYTEGLLSGVVDRNLLIEASADFEAWVLAEKKKNWDSQTEAYYLNAVRLAIIAGDYPRAATLLHARRSLRSHREEYELLKALPDYVDTASSLVQQYRENFDTLFDRVRDPLFDPDQFIQVWIARFELGLIRELRLIRPGEPLDMHNVITAIAR